MGPLQLPDVLAGHELRPAAAAAAGQPIAGALLSVQGRGHRQTHQLEATAQESRKGVRQPAGHVRRRQFGGFAGAIAKAVEGGQQRRRRRCGAHADDIRRVSDRLRDARDRGGKQLLFSGGEGIGLDQGRRGGTGVATRGCGGHDRERGVVRG